MLVGPLLLLIYEPAIGAVRWRDSVGFIARIGVLGVLASLWWIVPLLVHVRYGIDFLQFTEQPRSIWATNSITESLRLMGYWTSYIGVGFGRTHSFFSDGGTLLFNPLVVGASLLLPALALAGFIRARYSGYAPFLLLLVVVGVVVMMAGFPNGTALRSAMESIYHNIFVLRFMRTTNKAAPLVALGLAGLLGLGASQAWLYLCSRPRTRLRGASLIAAPLSLGALIVLASLPLIRGDALDRGLLFKGIPAAWTSAGRGLDRELPSNSRALVLPGSIFAYYKWGGTLDPILPRLTDRPVAVRYETPYSDLRAVDLLTTVDSLVQQRRLLPGQLLGLLDLMGVRSVVSGTDYDVPNSGVLEPAAAAAQLTTGGLGAPSRTYGPRSLFAPAAGDVGAPTRLAQVSRYDIGASRGIVHVDAAGPSTIVDGGAGGLADMAAFGPLAGPGPILYAGDMSSAAIAARAAAGAEVVVTDSNRRRVFLPQYPQQDLGPTLGANDPIDINSAVINPFPAKGSDAQTVSVLQGASYLRAPEVSGFAQFPEHRPIAALDGDLETSWLAERYVEPAQRYLEIGFSQPRDVPYVDVYPLSDSRAVVTRVQVNGIYAAVGPTWTRIRLGLHHVGSLRLRIAQVTKPRFGPASAGGFREIRVPGLHVRELLRTPIVTARALAGRDLSHTPLTYLFERTTGDNPFLRNRYGASPGLVNVEDRGDGEKYIDRAIFAPAPRSYRPSAWVYPSSDAHDPAFDRLAGMPGAASFDSSSRFEDQPRYRASSAFDGRPDTAWVSVWAPPDAPAPWISWTGARPLTFDRLRLVPARLAVRRPTLVRLSADGVQTPPLAVGADGSVAIGHTVHGRSFRLTILDASFAAGTPVAARTARAVGIRSLLVPGMAAVNVAVNGPLHAACGDVRVRLGGVDVPLLELGTIAGLDSGQPLQARSCGAGVPIAAGIQTITALPGPFSIDLLRLHSAAPQPLPLGPAGPASAGRVLSGGHIGSSSVDGVRVALSKASWLVLGESFDQGWRATCDGRTLGAAIPIDGYANGWLAPASCRSVAFSFAPQDGVRISYVISAIVCALLIAFLLAGWLATRRDSPALLERRTLRDGLGRQMGPLRAGAVALIAAVPLAAIFALRAGAVLFIVLTFALWRGLSARTLIAVALGLLGIAVPIAYLIGSPAGHGGYDFAYSTELISAHWIGVGAIVLLGLALWQIISATRADPDQDAGRSISPTSTPRAE
jgi:hypothetical protein